jgi:uncharacterized membrane protein YccC
VLSVGPGEDAVVDNSRLRRLALRGLALVAALCVAGVVVSVVIHGTDGRLTDWLAVVAVAALVACWRLYRPAQHQTD